MKTLILVRHAKAEQSGYSQSDFNRKLLTHGEKECQLIAQQLKNKNYHPDIFISSDAKRAMQTASIFAETLNYNKSNIITEHLLYKGYTTADMQSYIGELDNTKQSAIIFGHNPDIASLAVNLSSEQLLNFPTGVAVILKFNTNDWNNLEVRTGKIELYIYPNMFI